MKMLVKTAALGALALVPLGALACGDSTASATPEQLGLQAPPPASRAPDAVAKAAQAKVVKPATPDGKSPAQGPVKVAVSR